MVEVPSAVYIIAELARRVDSFSIGTNDLTQFLLAVDRSNPWVQGFLDNLHPAVVHVVGDIIQRGHRQNKPVSVCGEMAGNPASVLLLLGLGVDSLSMTPSSLPRVKWTIRSFTMKQARVLVDKALKIDNEADIESCLEGRRPQLARAREVTFQKAKTVMHATEHKTSGFAALKVGASLDTHRTLKTN